MSAWRSLGRKEGKRYSPPTLPSASSDTSRGCCCCTGTPATRACATVVLKAVGLQHVAPSSEQGCALGPLDSFSRASTKGRPTSHCRATSCHLMRDRARPAHCCRRPGATSCCTTTTRTSSSCYPSSTSWRSTRASTRRHTRPSPSSHTAPHRPHTAPTPPHTAVVRRRGAKAPPSAPRVLPLGDDTSPGPPSLAALDLSHPPRSPATPRHASPRHALTTR